MIYKIKKLSCFVFTTLLFCSISIIIKNVAILFFNNKNLGLFTIDYIKNYGAAFSLFNNHTMILAIISFVILFLLLIHIVKNVLSFKKSDYFFYSLLLAGIISNLSERLLDGYVTDYIRLNWFAFPIFNISDLFICIGSFILICNILFNNEQQD